MPNVEHGDERLHNDVESPRPKHGPWRRRKKSDGSHCFSFCGHQHIEFSCGNTFVYLIGIFCTVLSLHNVTAVPWFMMVTPATDANPDLGEPRWGMESAPNWYALLGYRGAKLWPDPALFLGPHTALLSIVLMAYATWWVRFVLVHDMLKSVIKQSSSPPAEAARLFSRADTVFVDQDGKVRPTESTEEAYEVKWFLYDPVDGRLDSPFDFADDAKAFKAKLDRPLYDMSTGHTIGITSPVTDRVGTRTETRSQLICFENPVKNRVDVHAEAPPAETTSTNASTVPEVSAILGSFLLFAHAVPIVLSGPGLPNLGPSQVWAGLGFCIVAMISLFVEGLYHKRNLYHKRKLHRAFEAIGFMGVQIVVLSEAVPDFFEVISGVISWIGFTPIATDLEGECQYEWCDRLDPGFGWTPQGGEAGNVPHPLSGRGPYSGSTWGAVVGPIICVLLLLWYCRVALYLLCPTRRKRKDQLRVAGIYRELEREPAPYSVPSESDDADQIGEATSPWTAACAAFKRAIAIASGSRTSLDVLAILAANVATITVTWYIFRVAQLAKQSSTCLEPYQLPGFTGVDFGDKPIYNHHGGAVVEHDWAELVHSVQVYGKLQLLNAAVLASLAIGITCGEELSCTVGVGGMIVMPIPNLVVIVILAVRCSAVSTACNASAAYESVTSGICLSVLFFVITWWCLVAKFRNKSSATSRRRERSDQVEPEGPALRASA